MNKTQRIKEFVKVSLEENLADLRSISVKEAVANLGLGIIMVLVVALNLALSVWQLTVSLLLVGYDLIAKGLGRFMEKVKIPVQNAKG